MNTFVVRNNPRLIYIIKDSWRYFLKGYVEGVKITIRKNDVFIHLDCANCQILTDLVYMINNPSLYKVEFNKKALDWLKYWRGDRLLYYK